MKTYKYCLYKWMNENVKKDIAHKIVKYREINYQTKA